MGFHRYEIRTKTWVCPSCHSVAKKETTNEAIETALILCFPIGIIVWSIRGIIKLFKKREFTSSGDEIIKCSNCGRKVVITKG